MNSIQRIASKLRLQSVYLQLYIFKGTVLITLQSNPCHVSLIFSKLQGENQCFQMASLSLNSCEIIYRINFYYYSLVAVKGDGLIKYFWTFPLISLKSHTYCCYMYELDQILVTSISSINIQIYYTYVQINNMKYIST